MRKISVLLCLAAVLLLSGCAKEKLVTKPCGFDVRIEWVRSSKLQFTVKADNENATYVYGIMSLDDSDMSTWSDERLMEWQLEWMMDTYELMQEEQDEDDAPLSPFYQLFCFKGSRTIKETRLSPGCNYQVLVFQVNPETLKAIGPLYRVPFTTVPMEKKDITFTLQNYGDSFTIIPSDPEVDWFWEYETEERIDDVYGAAFFFFYNIIDMYDEYDFLSHLLCKGPEEWRFPEDDPSIREGENYILTIATITNGEISSDVSYAEFNFQDGRLTFTYNDFPVENMVE